ncbi:ABC transporter permease [Pseudooceanicola sp. 502str34]
MNWRHVYHLGLKELSGLFQETVLVILILYSFTLDIYTTAKAQPETLNAAPIAVVDEDRSQASTMIVSAFYPPYFVAPRLIDAAEMDARMDAGLDTFSLVIPAGFQADLLAGKTPDIQLNVDATRMTQAFTGTSYVQQIVTSEVTEFLNHTRTASSSPVEIVIRSRFNPTLDAGWFGSIQSVILSITMLSIILTGAALIREREHGTVEHLLVMPVRPIEIMLAKIWAMAAVVLVGAAVAILVVVQLLLGVPIIGSVWLFLAGTLLMLFASTCMGIFLATMAGSMPQFGLLLMLVLLPLQVLSGGMTPAENMPAAVRFVMQFTPNPHFVSLSQAVLFRGAGLAEVWPQLVAMAVITVALFALALGRFRSFLR